ncbi:MAG: cytochrome c biogenesis protein CcdA, partial [Bacilli bacterium]
LPLYPSYLSYITGVSVKDIRSDQSQTLRLPFMIHTLFFILGFSIIFIALGFGASFLGTFFLDYQDEMRQFGAILIIVMGLLVLGVWKSNFFLKERRFQLLKKPTGYLGSILVGMSFAAGWTPCVGPILTAVLTVAAAEPGRGVGYMFAYTLGFAIPFFILSFFIGRTRWILRYSERIMKIGGVIMIVMGILLYTDQLTVITRYLINLFGGFTGF